MRDPQASGERVEEYRPDDRQHYRHMANGTASSFRLGLADEMTMYGMMQSSRSPSATAKLMA